MALVEYGWRILSNSEVRRKLLGPVAQCLEQALNSNRLRVSGHDLRMLTDRLPRCPLFFEEGIGSDVVQGNVGKSIKISTSRLAGVDGIVPPSLGSRGPLIRCLKALGEMAECRNQ